MHKELCVFLTTLSSLFQGLRGKKGPKGLPGPMVSVLFSGTLEPRFNIIFLSFTLIAHQQTSSFIY